MCRLSWFLDPGGWSKATTVGLYFIFPGICTLSLTCPEIGFSTVQVFLNPLKLVIEVNPHSSTLVNSTHAFTEISALMKPCVYSCVEFTEETKIVQIRVAETVQWVQEFSAKYGTLIWTNILAAENNFLKAVL
ncbi:hypothetical protein STEG23_010632 [Scotinomys teguina]